MLFCFHVLNLKPFIDRRRLKQLMLFHSNLNHFVNHL